MFHDGRRELTQEMEPVFGLTACPDMLVAVEPAGQPEGIFLRDPGQRVQATLKRCVGQAKTFQESARCSGGIHTSFSFNILIEDTRFRRAFPSYFAWKNSVT